MADNPSFRAHLKLFGMAVVWGASWPWGRIVAQNMPPMTAACLRFALASLVLLAWVWQRGGLRTLLGWNRRQWVGLVLAAATGIFGYALFFMLGLQHIPASKGALIITLTPVVTLLLSVWLFHELLNRRIGIGMLLAVMGAVVVLTHGDPSRVFEGGIGLGEVLILGCVVSWSVYTLIGRGLLAGVDAVATTTVTALLGAGMLLLASLAFEGGAAYVAVWNAPVAAWMSLVLLALGATATAYSWYFAGIKVVGAGTAAAYIILVPVFGVLFSALWLGETIDYSIALGGIMAVGGMAVMHAGRMSGTTSVRRRA